MQPWQLHKIKSKTHLGVNLHCPLQQAVDAHVRRAAAKETAEPCRGQHDQQRRVRVGANHHDSVPPLDPPRLHGCRQASRIVSQLPPRHGALVDAALANLRHRHLVVVLVLCATRARSLLQAAAIQQVLGKVEADALEPAREPVDGNGFIHDALVTALVDPALRLPEVAPEVGTLGTGPLVELIKGLQSAMR